MPSTRTAQEIITEILNKHGFYWPTGYSPEMYVVIYEYGQRCRQQAIEEAAHKEDGKDAD